MNEIVPGLRWREKDWHFNRLMKEIMKMTYSDSQGHIYYRTVPWEHAKRLKMATNYLELNQAIDRLRLLTFI